MNKAELILKISKNAGIPDTDAKIFFELFLKKTSAIIDVGQSLSVNGYGYFHLIKGSIKKPVFSFSDNQINEESINLILFTENKNLKGSDTKGQVFSIPFLDEEDYHPIDSSFSLSIGKPLIPLRGLPSDNLFIPTSGFEYRRLLESKVEKLISQSEVIESEEDFPTLVIDASSYNSNQVQLKWEEATSSEKLDILLSSEDSSIENKAELSDYEKQSRVLKNIAWDFGDDLSKQLEPESILDIADEKIKSEINSGKIKQDIQNESSENIEIIFENDKSSNIEEPLKIDNINVPDQTNIQFESEIEPDIDSSFDPIGQPDAIEIREQLSFQPEQNETEQEDTKDKFETELSLNDPEVVDITELVNQSAELSEDDDMIKFEDELDEKEFWQSTSKYFETYNPGSLSDVNGIKYPDNTNSEALKDELSSIPEQISQNIDKGIPSRLFEKVDEIAVDDETKPIENDEEPIGAGDMVQNDGQEQNELDNEESKKAEFFESESNKSIVPFIVFPLIVIILSAALYWYLEYYKKGNEIPEQKRLVLNLNNGTVIKRDFTIPVTYPYSPMSRETAIIKSKEIEVDSLSLNQSDEKTIDKNINTDKPKQEINEPLAKINKDQFQKTEKLSGAGLNVGDNIYKYGSYYVVQVAAFRSISISENEAGKYRDKGFNAFVEEAQIPDRGIWYRVRVGNFSSLDEAKSFSEKNIR